MKFRNYCIAIMGETEGALAEVIKISDIQPNALSANGIFIATFSSVAEIAELTDYFKINGRNFLLFDLNEKYSGFNFEKKDIQEGLFGFLRLMNEESLTNKTNQLIKELSSSTVSNKTLRLLKNSTSEDNISIDEIDLMSYEDKNKLMNKLIDKGSENLSEYDKNILKKLSN